MPVYVRAVENHGTGSHSHDVQVSLGTPFSYRRVGTIEELDEPVTVADQEFRYRLWLDGKWLLTQNIDDALTFSKGYIERSDT